jgi:hypothetical protein
MWGKHSAIPLSAALFPAVVALVLTAAPAVATASGAQGEPLLGDLNNDRIIDRVALSDAPPEHCAVHVELGLPQGGFQTSQTHTYPRPGGVDGVSYCPDMGVVVDLGGDGTVELVLAWFDGRPPGVDTDLLVLRDFTPVAGFEAIYQPSNIRVADFNGDRRQDVYEWTDQGEGFVSYLNTAEGRLEPGPVRFPHFCTPDPDFDLADFHRSGGLGLSIAYFDLCDSGATGVTVVGQYGTRVDLEHDPDGLQWWSQSVLDANGDRIPDVRTDNEATGEVTYFLGLGDGRFVESPRAVADRTIASPTRPTVIRVLANDAAARQARVSVTIQPRFGRARVNADRTITYTPLRPHDGADRFVYRIHQDGKQNTTSVSVRFPG